MRSIRGGALRAARFATLLAVTLAAVTPARAAFWDAPVERATAAAPVVTPLPRVVPAAPAEPTPLIYAISDLHIGEGVRASGKMSPLEDFTVDDEFEDFIDHAIGQRDARGAGRAKLVLHGDVFDFLKITTPPRGAKFTGSQKERDAADVAADEDLAVLKMRRVVEAHPRVIRGLRTWMAAGNDLVIVAGNHDQELFYGRVRQVLRAALGPEQAHMTFEPYLHLDGDVLIEHGQRYDPMNAVSHMLYPFSSMKGDRRLRPSVGNFVVVQLNNRFKEKVPELNYLSRGRAMLMAVLRRAPKDLLAVVPFALRIAGLTGNKAPTHASRAIAQEHVRRLTTGPWIERQRATINATRAERGQAPLSAGDMRRLMLRWDGLSAKPYLETMDLGKNRFAGMMRLLRPREFKKWVDATFGNTAPGALELAFSEMVNVHVQGHTHVAGIEDATIRKSAWGRGAARNDNRRRWVVNTGAWIPHMEHGHPDARSFLTFLEVTRDGGETTPRLLRWDTKTRSMVAANGGSQPEERGRASRPGRVAPVMGLEAARRNAESPTRVISPSARQGRAVGRVRGIRPGNGRS